MIGVVKGGPEAHGKKNCVACDEMWLTRYDERLRGSQRWWMKHQERRQRTDRSIVFPSSRSSHLSFLEISRMPVELLCSGVKRGRNPEKRDSKKITVDEKLEVRLKSNWRGFVTERKADVVNSGWKELKVGDGILIWSLMFSRRWNDRD